MSNITEIKLQIVGLSLRTEHEEVPCDYYAVLVGIGSDTHFHV